MRFVLTPPPPLENKNFFSTKFFMTIFSIFRNKFYVYICITYNALWLLFMNTMYLIYPEIVYNGPN